MANQLAAPIVRTIALPPVFEDYNDDEVLRHATEDDVPSSSRDIPQSLLFGRLSCDPYTTSDAASSSLFEAHGFPALQIADGMPDGPPSHHRRRPTITPQTATMPSFLTQMSNMSISSSISPISLTFSTSSSSTSSTHSHSADEAYNAAAHNRHIHYGAGYGLAGSGYSRHERKSSSSTRSRRRSPSPGHHKRRNAPTSGTGYPTG